MVPLADVVAQRAAEVSDRARFRATESADELSHDEAGDWAAARVARLICATRARASTVVREVRDMASLVVAVAIPTVIIGIAAKPSPH